MKHPVTACIALSALGLSACSGGPQFTPLYEKIQLAGPAASAVAAAEASATPADAYQQNLRAEYLKYAQFELNKMSDYGDAIFHSERAQQAASGASVTPQTLDARILPASAQSELSAARQRLISALDAGGSAVAPSAAARATASFDCWMEQAEENIQPNDIAACKIDFEAAMDELEASLAAQAAAEKTDRAAPALPDVITLDSDVVFGFDSATINPSAADALVEVAQLINSNPGTQLIVQGHTDSVGSEAYNLGLSERRAQSVMTFLVNQGADADRFTIDARGESSPIADNDTKEGRAMNRRVEIRNR